MRERLTYGVGALALGALLAAASGVNVPPARADIDRMYSVSCYIGNPGNNRNIGSIQISDITSAGPLCNATFPVCEGKCVGCVNDFDLDGTVCYDRNGKKFLP